MPNANEIIEQIKQIDNIQDFNKIKDFIESQTDDLEEKILSDFANYTFKIPYYQRGYRWSKDNIEALLDDLKEFLDDSSEGNLRYILQPLAIAKTKNKNEFEVIDGQQRLTTLYLIHKFLVKSLEKTNSSWYSFSYDYEDNGRNNCTKISTILENDITPYSSENDGIDENSINVFYVKKAYTAINNWFNDNSSYKEKIYELLIEKDVRNKKAIMFLWYEVQENLKASVFQNINSNKIQLTNDDLIKALFLSETTGLQNREQIAAQYEIMERQFNLDKFWFMFNKKDVNRAKGQARIDFLFNIYKNQEENDKDNDALVSIEEYQNDSRTAFYKIMKLYHEDNSILNKIWKSVRKNYQILVEFYKNPEYFHYVGFIRYACDDTKFRKILLTLLSKYDKCIKKDITVRVDTDDDFVNSNLKEQIKNIIISENKNPIKLDDLFYSDNKRKVLRLIFLLHNIETILCDYKKFRKLRGISTAIEYFPFEIFYKQNWQIEHIASFSTNTLDNPKDRLECLKSYLKIYKQFNNNQPYEADNYNFENPNLDSEYIKEKDKFDIVFETIKNEIEKIDNKSMPMEYTSQGEKNSIKNLVLLDSKTNQEYHNATLPNKREKILHLMKNEALEDDEIRYIPICTRSVFLKAYNNNNGDFAYWTREDANLYLNDMEQKLKFYIDKQQEK